MSFTCESPAERLAGNRYPGRGIIIGKSADGKSAVAAYFIMGRSVNSRNRVFEATDDGIRTRAYDPSKVADPSLIIYNPVRVLDNHLIVTNGDQTDTIRDYIKAGGSFSEALATREFEPDAPNYTPRISGMLTFAEGDFSYQLSILRCADAAGVACDRFTYAYVAVSGRGHLLHTYNTDGEPLPSFTGEPRTVSIGNDLEAFSCALWEALDTDNKISLYVSFTDLATGKTTLKLTNKYN